jgi:dihydroorotate dehydrogenase (fumarate)
MDLSTQYLGLDLASPLVPSASPLSRGLDTCRQLEDAGAGAIILWSLFEEALTAETETSARFLSEQHTGFAEASHFLPNYHDYPPALDSYLEHLRRLKETLGIPVIASLNGVTVGGWIAHARALEAAGADALELNVYYVAANPEESGAQVEERYLGLLGALRHQVSLPINMKLSPNFSSVANMVKRLEAAGADGVALFNRFYQPDIHLDSLRLRPGPLPLHLPRIPAGDALDRPPPWPGRSVTGGHRRRAHRRGRPQAAARRRGRGPSVQPAAAGGTRRPEAGPRGD